MRKSVMFHWFTYIQTRKLWNWMQCSQSSLVSKAHCIRLFNQYFSDPEQRYSPVSVCVWKTLLDLTISFLLTFKWDITYFLHILAIFFQLSFWEVKVQKGQKSGLRLAKNIILILLWKDVLTVYPAKKKLKPDYNVRAA